MIAYLEGTVLRRDAEACILLTSGGVGYQVHMTVGGLASLPGAGDTARLFVHTLVREDALVLYGFGTWEEREAFEPLLAAPKLGPGRPWPCSAVTAPRNLRPPSPGRTWPP
jgi:Holliday junction DNA helicase RuvA